jgi:hypothetical protein
VVPGTSLSFVGLHQLAIDKDAVLRRSEACEEKLSFLLDDYGVLFLSSYDELIAFSQIERKHPEVLDGNLPVNANFQVARELIEREIDLMLFLTADRETELHGDVTPDRYL